jgi:hypothetical protein
MLYDNVQDGYFVMRMNPAPDVVDEDGGHCAALLQKPKDDARTG